MIHKLPKWVEFCGFLLALVAGSVNAIALLGFNHQGVSHLSGSSTLLGVELAAHEYAEALHLLFILCSFVLGACLSGFLLEPESLKLGRRYSLALFLESFLLCSAMVFLNEGSNLGHYLASAACGLQNAMTSTFSGAMVRTTHVTGLFTDLGVALGQWLRGHNTGRRRLILFLILIAGFMLGGFFGALCFSSFRFYALLVPALITALIGLSYLLFWFRNQRVN